MDRSIMSNGTEKLAQQIEDSYDDIGALLDKDKINSREVMKKFLSTNRLIMAFFIGTFMEDHKKVDEMYSSYKMAKWFVVLLAMANILFFANQLLGVVFPTK